ncbi:unnamed protein product [Dicrocoelium dendriticum]|nr:unnamed protein product [Dicrocoelium dendriticum]
MFLTPPYEIPRISPFASNYHEESGRHVKLNYSGTIDQWMDETYEYSNRHPWDLRQDTVDYSAYLKVKINARGYRPEDIKVSASRSRIVVHGRNSRSTTRTCGSCTFCRTVYLPQPVKPDQLECHLTSNGVLILETPIDLWGRESQACYENTPTEADQNDNEPPISTVKNVAGRKMLRLRVPIEPGFTIDDLSVRADSTHVVVSGRTRVMEGSVSAHCSHSKEFSRTYTMPDTVDPLSAVARLYGETLVVEATILKSS